MAPIFNLTASSRIVELEVLRNDLKFCSRCQAGESQMGPLGLVCSLGMAHKGEMDEYLPTFKSTKTQTH